MSVRPCHMPSNPRIDVPEVSGSAARTHRAKRRLVVGNVSKWIQCDQREDQSTHKWMMYVRGDRERPDVSDVVSKVRFLIHPSYHPHDLIDVERPPFHLVRRGWGEFSARVQVHFRDVRNKPVDIIHHLKLDKTYTGLQTLGAETVVDVWLRDEERGAAARSRVKRERSEAIIDKFETAPEGLVIPHDDVSDVIDQSFLPDFNLADLKEESTEAKVEPSSPAFSPTKMVVFKTESGQLQQRPLSQVQASQMEASAGGCRGGGLLPNNNVLSPPTAASSCNGAAPSSPGSGRTSYVKYKDKKGKNHLLPVTVLPNNRQKFVPELLNGSNWAPDNGAKREASDLTSRLNGCANPGPSSSSTSKECRRKPPEAAGAEVVAEHKVVAYANGISLVKERPIVRGGGGGGKSKGGHVSLLRSSSPSAARPRPGGGVSLLKKNSNGGASSTVSASPPPPVVASITNSSGMRHVVSVTPERPTATTMLEQAAPHVSLEQWNIVLGRGEDEEDRQSEVEERLGKRSWELIKRQMRHYKLLR